jgi:hypothetical protein
MPRRGNVLSAVAVDDAVGYELEGEPLAVWEAGQLCFGMGDQGEGLLSGSVEGAGGGYQRAH